MKKKTEKIITIVVLLLAVAWGSRSIMRKFVSPAMQFQSTELITIDNSDKININGLKGNVLIVSCYQTWCGDCARETPVLDQLATELDSTQFKVIYISDEAAEKQMMFRNRFASGKILFTKSEQSMAQLGIHVYPTTYLLNKKGQVIKTKLEGYIWLNEKELITKLIAE